jgi:hypothetical protein
MTALNHIWIDSYIIFEKPNTILHISKKTTYSRSQMDYMSRLDFSKEGLSCFQIC